MTPLTGGTLLPPCSKMVSNRVESVWSASGIRSNSSRIRPIRSVPSVMSRGGCSSTLGLGLCAHASDVGEPLLELANRGEVLVELVAIGCADFARETAAPRPAPYP